MDTSTFPVYFRYISVLSGTFLTKWMFSHQLVELSSRVITRQQQPQASSAPAARAPSLSRHLSVI